MCSLKRTPFHSKTPLVYSEEMSRVNSDATHTCHVYLKLDNCQPSGSFKIRGVGHHILQSYETGDVRRIVSSSGGNAGLAAAYAANQLAISATIVVPTTTGQNFIDKLRGYNADVVIHGAVWNEADVEARRIVSSSEGALYVPPFDHPLVWEGNATIIDELAEQLNGVIPDCIIASVGGGGLACGLIQGLVKHGWMTKTKLIAVETEGANCFAESIKNDKMVVLDAITSIAKSLGAKSCAPQLMDLYRAHSANIESLVLTDKEAIEGLIRFLDEHRILVEPACGVSLSAAYQLASKLNTKFNTIVVVVCGGSGISLSGVVDYKKMFNL